MPSGGRHIWCEVFTPSGINLLLSDLTWHVRCACEKQRSNPWRFSRSPNPQAVAQLQPDTLQRHPSLSDTWVDKMKHFLCCLSSSLSDTGLKPVTVWGKGSSLKCVLFAQFSFELRKEEEEIRTSNTQMYVVLLKLTDYSQTRIIYWFYPTKRKEKENIKSKSIHAFLWLL